MVRFRGRNIYLHRLAFALRTGGWPAGEVDHRDGDGTNNRWSNLRESTHAQNIQNIGLPRHNTSGVKGVRYYAKKKKWHAQIQAHGKRIHIGFFGEKADAVSAYRRVSAEVHGDFSRVE